MSATPVSIAANPRMPAPKNEPSRDFVPGSPESRSVSAAIENIRANPREIPHVVNGERIMTADTTRVVEPHAHRSVIGTMAVADETVTKKAIAASLAAAHEWSRTPWWERAAIMLRAGDLAAGKYRDELVAATMTGQSKTFHQSEIDAASEFADFMRYNAHLAQQIYADQPASLPGDINILDQRPLEGFVLAITPFNFTAIGVNLPTTPALMGNTVVWKPAEKAALAAEVTMRVLEEAGLAPGVINLVHGSGAAVSSTAIADPDFAGLTFTGSTAVFRSLWRAVGNNIDTYRSFPGWSAKPAARTPSSSTRRRTSTLSAPRWSVRPSSTRARSAPRPHAPTSRARCGTSSVTSWSTSSANCPSATRPSTRPTWAR